MRVYEGGRASIQSSGTKNERMTRNDSADLRSRDSHGLSFFILIVELVFSCLTPIYRTGLKLKEDKKIRLEKVRWRHEKEEKRRKGRRCWD